METKVVSPGGDDKKPAKNTLTAEQAAAFRAWYHDWTRLYCVDVPGGEVWSQHRVAARLGVTQTEISDWLSNKANPGLQRLLLISRNTQVDLLDILGCRLPSR